MFLSSASSADKLEMSRAVLGRLKSPPTNGVRGARKVGANMGIHKFDNVEPDAYAQLIEFARDARNASIGDNARTPVVRVLKVALARNAPTGRVMGNDEIETMGQLSLEILIEETLRKRADGEPVDVTTSQETINAIFEIIGKYPRQPRMKRACDRD